MQNRSTWCAWDMHALCTEASSRALAVDDLGHCNARLQARLKNSPGRDNGKDCPKGKDHIEDDTGRDDEGTLANRPVLKKVWVVQRVLFQLRCPTGTTGRRKNGVNGVLVGAQTAGMPAGD